MKNINLEDLKTGTHSGVRAPLFFAIEGCEGSGKSSIAKKVGELLESAQIDHIITREPGGNDNKVSESIRNIIMEHDISPATEVLLFAASRHEHIKNTILPKLNDGGVVLCDRYLDSSRAYQAIHDEIDDFFIMEANRHNGLIPGITFFIDVKPEVSLQRIKDNQRDTNRFDEFDLDFHNKVYENYKKITTNCYQKDRYISIDGSQSIEAIAINIYKEIFECFNWQEELKRRRDNEKK